MTLPLNNYIGCIIGGAVGDALGAPTEFKGTYELQEKYGPNAVNNYIEYEDGKGEITDDTQMLLFTADGLLRAYNRASEKGIGGAYLTYCYEAYLRWLYTQNDWHSEKALEKVRINGWLVQQEFLHKRRAPGQTCLTALCSRKIGSIEHPINNSKGCGGIMRIAPVGLIYANSTETAFKMGAEIAAITHGHPSGYLSSGYLSALIFMLNRGFNLQIALETCLDILSSYTDHQETTNAIKDALALHKLGAPDYYKVNKLGQGWVGEEALAISLYCVLCYPNDFEKAINLAINHDGDTDSTGAITGNILGLILGEEAIPQRWLNNLNNYNEITQVALDLYDAANNNTEADWRRKFMD